MLIGVIFSCGSTWDYEIWETSGITLDEFDDLLEEGDWNKVYRDMEKYATKRTDRYLRPLNDVDVIFWI